MSGKHLKKKFGLGLPTASLIESVITPVIKLENMMPISHSSEIQEVKKKKKSHKTAKKKKQESKRKKYPILHGVNRRYPS